MDRKTALPYSLLVAITTISASIAVAWFGPGSSLGSVTGFIGPSESVWFLFAAPALLTVVGLIGAVGLASTRIVYAPLDELGSDSQRALETGARHLERVRAADRIGEVEIVRDHARGPGQTIGIEAIGVIDGDPQPPPAVDEVDELQLEVFDDGIDHGVDPIFDGHGFTSKQQRAWAETHALKHSIPD